MNARTSLTSLIMLRRFEAIRTPSRLRPPAIRQEL